MNQRQAYAALGLPQGTSANEIKAAYRRLAMTWHPDRNQGNKDAEERFKVIQQAYDTLNPSAAPARRPIHNVHEVHPRRSTKRADLEFAVNLSLRDAVYGVTLTFTPEQERSAVNVTVPAGVEAGQVMVVTRAAHQGDLIIVFDVHPHTRFERKGLDLHTHIDVPVHTCVLGGEIDVVLLDGSHLTVQIPTGNGGGGKLRLKGKGVPKGAQHGDVYLTVRPTIPKDLTPAQQRAWRSVKRSMEAPTDGVATPKIKVARKTVRKTAKTTG